MIALDKCDGDVTYVLSRKKHKVIFEFSLVFSLQLELLDANKALDKIIPATLKIPELTNHDLAEEDFPNHTLKCEADDDGDHRATFGDGLKVIWPDVQQVMQSFIDATIEKWRD